MTQNDHITDLDLQAFIDGQLDDIRRVEVEDYLARHPAVAAEVMASMRTKDALRILAKEQDEPSPRLQAEAARLQQGLTRQLWGRRLLRMTGVAAALVAGIIIFAVAHPFGPKPSEAATLAFVDDALDAQRALRLRQRMASQIEATTYDPAELENQTNLAMPYLPTSWEVRDVQIYPWDEGYSVGMTLHTDTLGTITLFAAPSRIAAQPVVHTAPLDGMTAVVWQAEDLTYVLIGQGPETALREAADKLSGNLTMPPARPAAG